MTSLLACNQWRVGVIGFDAVKWQQPVEWSVGQFRLPISVSGDIGHIVRYKLLPQQVGTKAKTCFPFEKILQCDSLFNF